MNSLASKIVAVVISLLLFAYVGYQAYVSFYKPYETEIVKEGTYIYDVDLDGFFVRDETVLDTKKQGVVSYRFKNADKIPKDATIARMYENESDLYNLRKVEKLKEQKSILQEALKTKNTEQLDVISNQVSASQLDLLKQVDDGNLTNLNNTYKDLLLNINKKELSINKNANISETITNIDNQITKLTSEISNKNIDVTTNKAGYFCNYVDGFETVFTLDSLKSISINDVQEKLKNKKTQPQENVGRIQSDTTWHFVSLIDAKDAESFAKGQAVTLKFSSKVSKKVTATVVDVISEKDNKKSVVVFTGNFFDEDISTMRFEKPKAIMKSYSGIQIPKEAIRVENGKKGVYTLLGKTVRFRLVDPVYEDNDILVSKSNSDTKYVSVYDKVITKGKDLHETK
ncbi:HlyD family efflux transporter periplasmic adaptor subunit [Paludicola sp. MB14-C6]|uniref:HlyD family efflux transporter periplasmic adaptor subunit n=1 Tax=Paludihabitans sp. MB14-C6 TaxID=3070656 RepID=UPI0027DC039F|nr:HlyD family efflux transporter periplasmic adaptor subunit [Paludicola sp. MB14-C6]WMJ23109.1 HlyD family efflux transporter periplasmic adaptor subunit [Paludicola sp. MB14-C6]